MSESVYLSCIEKMRALLGDEHVETLNSMNGLALLYEKMASDADSADDLKLLKKSRKLFSVCVAKSTASLGADHPDTVEFEGNLQRIVDRLSSFDDVSVMTTSTWRA